MGCVRDREYRLRRENAAEKTGKNGERGREALTFEQRHLGVKTGFRRGRPANPARIVGFIQWSVGGNLLSSGFPARALCCEALLVLTA